MTEMTEHDEINPDHYQAKDGSQFIDVIEAFELDFHSGCAVQYILRHDKKPHAESITDLEKAIWYLKRKIGLLRKQVDATPKSSAVPVAAAKPPVKGPITGGLSK